MVENNLRSPDLPPPLKRSTSPVRRNIISWLGARAFKGAYYVKRTLISALTRLRLSLIWTFNGKVIFAGPVYARAVSGQVIIGNRVLFGPFVNIDCARNASLVIGNNCTINQGTFIVSLDHIHIGSSVSIGEYCSIRDNDHQWENPSVEIREQGYTTAPVQIDDDVWIGRGVVIGKGVRIGRGAVIGANSVVVKDVEPFTVVGGIPAKIIKRRH